MSVSVRPFPLTFKTAPAFVFYRISVLRFVLYSLISKCVVQRAPLPPTYRISLIFATPLRKIMSTCEILRRSLW